MALKLTEYELIYSTHLWIFKGKSSRNYEGRNRGVTASLRKNLQFEDQISIFNEEEEELISQPTN